MRTLGGGIIGAIIALGLGWLFFRPGPTGADLVAPDCDVIAAQPTSTSVTLEWRHGGNIEYDGGVPQTAKSFVVCVYPSFSGQTCQAISFQGQEPDIRHIDGLADFPRTALPNVPAINGGNDPYEYEHSVTIGEDLYDENLSWTVAACATGFQGGCNVAVPNRLVVTGRNVFVVDISDNANSSQNKVDFDIEIANPGIVETGDFELSTSVYEILVDAAGNAWTNVNNTSGVANWSGALGLDNAVIMEDGTVHSILLLPLIGDGQRDTNKVYAILRPDGSRQFWRNKIPSISPDPGATSGLEYKPCPRAQQVLQLCEVNVTHSSRPTGFAVITTADPNGHITEFNEGDNRRMVNNVKLF